MTIASRNDPLGFADRTRKNLEALETAASRGADVHLVTQVTTSLLGLVAFPWEKKVSAHINAQSLTTLIAAGWPVWAFLLGGCHTLGDLARCLRNAIAHGRFAFSSESRVLKDVEVTFEDWKPNAKAAHWRASIRADHLREFCVRFIDLIRTSTGTHVP